MSVKKILLVGFIIVLLAAIPLTVYLVQQEQKTKSNANPQTTLSLVITPQNKAVGDNVELDVKVSPGNINRVSFVKFTITYDANKLTPVYNNCPQTNKNEVFCPTAVFPMPPMQGPDYSVNGQISVTLSAGSDPNKAIINNNTTIGTLNFTAKATTDANGTKVDFAPKPATEILSIGSNDQFNENVLYQALPAIIHITNASVTATPTVTPTGAPTTTPTATPTSVPGATATPTATPTSVPGASPTPITSTTGPTCASLTVDPAASGTAPYSVNLTANGQDSASTISKVTFDFGDGQTQDITNSSGIGTNSISVLQSHIYTNPGDYTATAVLTDASGNVSPISNCSMVISVNNGQTAIAATETPTATETSTPLQNEQTGPSGLVTIGSIGAIITIIGAVLLLAL
jgi:hypothetical protein